MKTKIDETILLSNEYGCNNPYYCPEFFDVIMKQFVPFLPLWTHLLEVSQSNIKNYTNAPIESYFGEVKNFLAKNANLYGKPPMSVGRFIIVLKDIIEPKTKIILNDIPRNKFTNNSYNKNNDMEPVETWNKKKISKVMKHFSNSRKYTSSKNVKQDNSSVVLKNGLYSNPKYYSKECIINDKKFDFIVCISNNEKIRQSSFISLENNTPVENFLIDILMKILITNAEKENVQIEPFYMGSILCFCSDDNTLLEITKGFHLEKEIILFPIYDEIRKHFLLITINNINQTFSIFDSLAYKKHEKNLMEKTYIKYFKNFKKFAELYNSSNNSKLKFLANYDTNFFPECPKQKGDTDCGIYMLMYAENFLKFNEIRLFPNSKLNIKRKRMSLQLKLLENSQSMLNICIICGNLIKHEKLRNLLKCIICKRFIHKDEYSKFDPTADFAKDFKCAICCNC